MHKSSSVRARRKVKLLPAGLPVYQHTLMRPDIGSMLFSRNSVCDLSQAVKMLLLILPRIRIWHGSCRGSDAFGINKRERRIKTDLSAKIQRLFKVIFRLARETDYYIR